MRIVGLLKNGKMASVAVPAAKAEPKATKKGARPNKAELLDECAALGIDAPDGATNPELMELIAAAKGAGE